MVIWVWQALPAEMELTEDMVAMVAMEHLVLQDREENLDLWVLLVMVEEVEVDVTHRMDSLAKMDVMEVMEEMDVTEEMEEMEVTEETEKTEKTEKQDRLGQQDKMEQTELTAKTV